MNTWNIWLFDCQFPHLSRYSLYQTHLCFLPLAQNATHLWHFTQHLLHPTPNSVLRDHTQLITIQSRQTWLDLVLRSQSKENQSPTLCNLCMCIYPHTHRYVCMLPFETEVTKQPLSYGCPGWTEPNPLDGGFLSKAQSSKGKFSFMVFLALWFTF